MTREIFCDFVLMCAHRLPKVPDGHQCSRVHGHNYQVRLYVTGPMDPEREWIIDYADLKKIWGSVVAERIDHQYINEALATVMPNPTCELIAEWIYLAMDDAMQKCGRRVSRVEVQEEPGSGVVLVP